MQTSLFLRSWDLVRKKGLQARGCKAWPVVVGAVSRELLRAVEIQE